MGVHDKSRAIIGISQRPDHLVLGIASYFMGLFPAMPAECHGLVFAC